MAAPRPTGSIDIWNFVDNVTGTTVRKWLRDSWARRKIVALQQAVANIVVPTKTSQLQNDSGFITSVPVQSVNGQTGAVNLDAADVGALPDSTVIPSKTSQLTNDSGYITSAPVTSVNGKTGAVNLTASDVGALPSSTAIPSKTSDLTNDSGYITASAIPSVPLASTTSPKMDGTASAGSSGAWSRGDHVHPHDTSKADKATTLSGYGITDAYTKSQVDGMIPTVPSNVSAFTNDVGYLTSYIETDPTVPAWAKANTKPTYTASEVGALPSNTPIPSKTSDLTNDSGFITGYTETDPTVPSWAKASTKPTYTASEVGAQATLDAAQMDAVNSGITAAKVAEYDGIETMFGLPITITSGSDLNDYMTPGHYSANTGAIAGSLTNCPTSVNFSLFVIYRTNTPLVSQIIIASTNAIYARYKSSTTWSSWYRFTGTAV